MYVDLLALRPAQDFFNLYDEGTYVGKGGQGKIYLHRKKKTEKFSPPSKFRDSFLGLSRFHLKPGKPSNSGTGITAASSASTSRSPKYITDDMFPEYVIRKVNYTADLSKSEILKERRVLSILNRTLITYKGTHPNILYSYFNHELGETPQSARKLAASGVPPQLQVASLMSYCNGGDLQKLFREHHTRRKRVPESFLWHILIQVSSGLAWLHRKPHVIVHRDVKPDNILLNFHPAAVYPTCKLADFDLACQFFQDSPPRPQCTYIYRPPEQGRRSGHATAKGDVYSLGATIQFMAGYFPPRYLSNEEWREWEMKAPRGWDDLPPCTTSNITRHGYSMHLYVVMLRAMHEAQWARPTASELLDAAETGKGRAGFEEDEGFEVAIGSECAGLRPPKRAARKWHTKHGRNGRS